MIWLLAGCNWVDLDDCKVSGEAHCELFRPEGYLCGLVHTAFVGGPGSGCDPPVEDAEDIFTPLRCPDGYVRGETSDSEASDFGDYALCAAQGTATRSSADLAEVPRGAACGFNHGNGGGTQNLCMGHDPQVGECPEGTELRWGYDIHGTTSGGGELDVQADLLVWCEVGDGGCSGEACPAIEGPVCGLHADGGHADDKTWVPQLVWDFVDPDLEAAVRARAEAGDVPEGRCDGLPEGECPDGMRRTCMPDVVGNKDRVASWMDDALCWCAPSEHVRDVGEPVAGPP